jgi:DNA-binding XRE family transcriptional regulator
MPTRPLPRIATVAAIGPGRVLRIAWRGGGESLVDLSETIARLRVFSALRDDPSLFGTVHVGDHGTDVVWTDAIDMSADMLWRLAREQEKLALSPEAFREWRERASYTLDGAARALGISRRMISYYEQGAKPIPRVVALAARALDTGSP